MAMTNSERVGKAMDLLRDGLGPFVAREVGERLRPGRIREETVRRFADDPPLAGTPIAEWDAGGLLRLMWEAWNEAFRPILGFSERSLVSELRTFRNRWAHQKRFTSDDADRALDSAERLLAAVSAPEADEVRRMKTELRRLVFEEQARNARRRAAPARIEAAGSGALKPWREVATPHPDVAGGRYRRAEFAADLWQVRLGQGEAEYRDPREFFRRTFLTSSLKGLLSGAVGRLNGQGGDPVVQLQTNFGGGKTHSLLALYHLFSGTAIRDLPEVEALVAGTGADTVPRANRAVLVGNKISPASPKRKPDGAEVRTLWGELAWQLGGAEAFQRVRADDEHATNPGDALRELLERYGPCVVLIDEWVAYARQLHERSDLPGGTFETQFTFAQALTEAVKLTKDCLLVVSLPASHRADQDEDARAGSDDSEVGGVRGREALDRLRNVVARVESSWRPASAEESFEIVRRRLFEPFEGPEAYKQRDVTVRAFTDLYRRQPAEFPAECRETDYEKRLRSAYPIHPEVFDRLYTDWSALPRFQRTRGVLRLMAAVIHQLWDSGDPNPLVLPSTIPMDAPSVQNELTRYLPEEWRPVIDKDVDGDGSLPVKIDREVPGLGRRHAARRVARAVWLGSAPTRTAARRGIDDRRVKLGCVAPGEPPAAFGDALRRLAAGATYLYEDGARVWYDTQPTVAKLAQDRAEELRRDPDRTAAELARRLKRHLRNHGGFAGVHSLPRAAADVPDDLETRLVVLSPEHPHIRGAESAAQVAANAILESRGSGPRERRNTLVFLAADKTLFPDLDEALRRFLAWESVVGDREALNLDPNQTRKAERQKADADTAADARVPEAYRWLLVPQQSSSGASVSWAAFRLSGEGALAERARRRLRGDDLLVADLAPSVLRRDLDEVPLWEGDHVPIRTLVEHFARYLYLPRLAGPEVLARSIGQGVGYLTWESDAFAVAESHDETAARYRGLQCGAVGVRVSPDSAGLVVKAEAARRQLDAESAAPDPDRGADEVRRIPVAEDEVVEPRDGREARPAARRFHGAVRLDATRAGRDASRIAEEVVAHLAGLVGAEVEVTLEIHADLSDGAPDKVVRTVTENCLTLKFMSHGFEEG